MLTSESVVKRRRLAERWIYKDVAAAAIGVSVEELVRMVGMEEITGKIHLGRLYVSRSDVEERTRKSEVLNYVIDKGRLYTFSKTKPGRRKIVINVTAYSKSRYGHEVADIAAAFEKDIPVIESIIKKNNLETVVVGDKRYVPVWSFRYFLETNQIKPG